MLIGGSLRSKPHRQPANSQHGPTILPIAEVHAERVVVVELSQLGGGAHLAIGGRFDSPAYGTRISPFGVADSPGPAMISLAAGMSP